MKKFLKYALVSVVVVVVLLAGMFGWMGHKMKVEISKMHALDTKEVVSNIYAVKDGFANMFLIKSGDAYIAVDAANDSAAVERELGTLKIAPESVVAVLLTHTDGDHVGAIKLFKNAKFYISKAEEQMINGKTARMAFFMKNSLSVPYTALEDGQELDIAGVHVKGILTPGHTPGSMCYIINGENLFIGDTLSLKDGQVQLMSEFFNMDSKTEGQSIKKLAGLQGITHIFTDHFGYTDDFQKAMAAWK